MIGVPDSAFLAHAWLSLTAHTVKSCPVCRCFSSTIQSPTMSRAERSMRRKTCSSNICLHFIRYLVWSQCSAIWFAVRCWWHFRPCYCCACQHIWCLLSCLVVSYASATRAFKDTVVNTSPYLVSTKLILCVTRWSDRNKVQSLPCINKTNFMRDRMVTKLLICVTRWSDRNRLTSVQLRVCMLAQTRPMCQSPVKHSCLRMSSAVEWFMLQQVLEYTEIRPALPEIRPSSQCWGSNDAIRCIANSVLLDSNDTFWCITDSVCVDWNGIASWGITDSTCLDSNDTFWCPADSVCLESNKNFWCPMLLGCECSGIRICLDSNCTFWFIANSHRWRL